MSPSYIYKLKTVRRETLQTKRPARCSNFSSKLSIFSQSLREVIPKAVIKQPAFVRRKGQIAYSPC